MQGLSYARWAGQALGLVLMLMGLLALMREGGGFEHFKGLYFVAYGVFLVFPYQYLRGRTWTWGFRLLCLLSALFVFVMIAHIMFAYMAAADRGERLGVPGLEGTLIFVSLLQVPVVLFQRRPDLID